MILNHFQSVILKLGNDLTIPCVRMETCNPQISGDLGGLEDFGTVDLTLPPIEWDGAKELEEAPPEVGTVP